MGRRSRQWKTWTWRGDTSQIRPAWQSPVSSLLCLRAYRILAWCDVRKHQKFLVYICIEIYSVATQHWYFQRPSIQLCLLEWPLSSKSLHNDITNQGCVCTDPQIIKHCYVLAEWKELLRKQPRSLIPVSKNANVHYNHNRIIKNCMSCMSFNSTPAVKDIITEADVGRPQEHFTGMQEPQTSNCQDLDRAVKSVPYHLPCSKN